MRVALALLLVGIGTLLFHFLSPWWWTPIASNWGVFDQTILITFAITGIVFVAVMLFLAYSVYKYRHREGHKAVYEPESKKLEIWLSLGTAVGVVALLTPGLFAWAKYINVPEGAAEVEVVGQQWTWSYRYPGEDGILGTTAIANITGDNPFGIDLDDPNGADDRLIASTELHMKLDQPIKLLFRSKDVLHNFYVPHFRAKMDMVPGMVTFYWMIPTRTGRFEVLCAELCGTGHYNMRGHVVVENPDDFELWLTEQPTFVESLASAGISTGNDLADQGKDIAQSRGCLGCHSIDGSAGVGPSWQGLYGKTETLEGGDTVLVDAAYLKTSIGDPNAAIVDSYAPSMPPYDLTDEELDALIAYIRSLS